MKNLFLTVVFFFAGISTYSQEDSKLWDGYGNEEYHNNGDVTMEELESDDPAAPIDSWLFILGGFGAVYGFKKTRLC